MNLVTSHAQCFSVAVRLFGEESCCGAQASLKLLGSTTFPTSASLVLGLGRRAKTPSCLFASTRFAKGRCLGWQRTTANKLKQTEAYVYRGSVAVKQYSLGQRDGAEGKGP